MLLSQQDHDKTDATKTNNKLEDEGDFVVDEGDFVVAAANETTLPKPTNVVATNEECNSEEKKDGDAAIAEMGWETETIEGGVTTVEQVHDIITDEAPPQSHPLEPLEAPQPNTSNNTTPTNESQNEPQRVQADSTNAMLPRKKKGLSARDRKLIKKYGSLEAAEEAAKARAKEEDVRQEKLDKNTIESTIAPTKTAAPKQPNPSRGRKGKKKKMAKKYADQDDEDRELAMMALQGGEKQMSGDIRGKKKTSKSGTYVDKKVSETQLQADKDTVALLVKDAERVALTLPEDVREVLAQCVTVKVVDTATQDESLVVRWNKFDGDVLEQLKATSPHEAQLAAVKRLHGLTKTSRIDNFASSLSGILRTIARYGYERLNQQQEEADANAALPKRKTKAEKESQEKAWKEIQAEDGTLHEEEEGDAVTGAIDDTMELNKLTGKPLEDDVLLHAIPVCAPYSSLSLYKYRVKLTPGSQKRGKASKQCIDMFLKSDAVAKGGGKNTFRDATLNKTAAAVERNQTLMKTTVTENEWIQTICGDVKISAPGASKIAKKQKSSSKKKHQKKK